MQKATDYGKACATAVLVAATNVNEVIVDRRDLYDFLRAAWRDGQDHGGKTSESERWDLASQHAAEIIEGWKTLRPALSGQAAIKDQVAAKASSTEQGSGAIEWLFMQWHDDHKFANLFDAFKAGAATRGQAQFDVRLVDGYLVVNDDQVANLGVFVPEYAAEIVRNLRFALNSPQTHVAAEQQEKK